MNRILVHNILRMLCYAAIGCLLLRLDTVLYICALAFTVVVNGLYFYLAFVVFDGVSWLFKGKWLELKCTKKEFAVGAIISIGGILLGAVVYFVITLL